MFAAILEAVEIPPVALSLRAEQSGRPEGHRVANAVIKPSFYAYGCMHAPDHGNAIQPNPEGQWLNKMHRFFCLAAWPA